MTRPCSVECMVLFVWWARKKIVVRKGEKRERTEKNQQYYQRVFSSHSMRKTILSVLVLPLFLFSSIALSFSSLLLSLSLLCLSLSSLFSPPLSSSPRTSCTCTVLSIGSPGWQLESGSGARLAFRCPKRLRGHSLIPPGGQLLVRMSSCHYWPRSSSTAAMRRAGSSGRSTTTITSATSLVFGGAPL